MRTRKVVGSWSYDDGEYLVQAQYTRGSPGVYTQRNGDPGWPDDPDEIEVLSVVEDSTERKPRPDLLDAASTDARLLDALVDQARTDAVEELYERAERAHDHADDERRYARGG